VTERIDCFTRWGMTSATREPVSGGGCGGGIDEWERKR
jgi:hypothetical protein